MSKTHFENKHLLIVIVALALAIVVEFIVKITIIVPKSDPAAIVQYLTPEEADPYVRFDMEAFDKIETNYWMARDKYNLGEVYRLALQKVLNQPQTLATSSRPEIVKMLAQGFSSATSTDMKKNMALQIVNIALYNLLPVGRNGLFSQAQEVALRQEVSNINPSNDLYKNLGVAKGADTQAVDVAYKQKQAELKNATSTEAKAELAQASYAHKVLTDSNSKELYDQNQIEPTVFPHILGKTLYLSINRISPTTLGEFARAVDRASTTPGLNSMVIDVRGNIGGALDFFPSFLGIFVGPNQYAFDLFHQGDYQVIRTTQLKFPELSRFREMAFLTDNFTQSTAELTTQMFKHFNLAHSVGTVTRGWGSVENTYPMTTVLDPAQKFSLLIVNSLTLRDDGQPIESNGVTPDIDITKSDWQNQSRTLGKQA